MDNKKALSKVAESCELLRMLEDLTNPALQNQLSQNAYGGIRITLRNVREVLVECHRVLSSGGGRSTPSSSGSSSREEGDEVDEGLTKSANSKIEREWQSQVAASPSHPSRGESLEFFSKSSGFSDERAGMVSRGDMRSSSPRYLD